MCPYIAKKGPRILGLDSPVQRHLEPREQCPTKPTYLPTFMLHDLATTHLDDYHRDTHTVPLYGGINAIAVRDYQALKFAIQFWGVNFDEVPFEL